MYARTYVLRCCLFLLETPFCAHLPRESHPSHSTSKLLYHTVQSVVYVRILLYCTYFFAIKEPKEQENGVKSYSQNTFRYANILSLEEYVIVGHCTYLYNIRYFYAVPPTGVENNCIRTYGNDDFSLHSFISALGWLRSMVLYCTYILYIERGCHRPRCPAAVRCVTGPTQMRVES